MILLDGPAASEEGHNEDDDTNNDQHHRSRRVELLIRQVHVWVRIVLSLRTHY